MTDLGRDAARIGALADPLRRRLYRFVCSQSDPVSRDQAAEAVAVPRHQAKFHLDRLEADGLLEASYVRLTGRSGPGAGRPAKLYRRTERDIAVSLPHREYRLAGELMASAIAESARTGEAVLAVLQRTAHDYGRTLGSAAAEQQPPGDADAALELAVAVLEEHGYEPRYGASAEVYLANCPFDALARTQTELACNMNHALVAGVAGALTPFCPRARLCPAHDRCCVVLDAGEPG